mgnify:CR=1 FL=1
MNLKINLQEEVKMSEYAGIEDKLEKTKSYGLYFENNAYYMNKDGETTGPYCSCCYDFYAKLVRLHSVNNIRENEEFYICPKCKTKVLKVEY